MPIPPRRARFRPTSVFVLACLAMLAVPPTLRADPPPWAPAYGERHHRDWRGDDDGGRDWRRDDDGGGDWRRGDDEDRPPRVEADEPRVRRPRIAAEILAGRCNHAAAGALLGGVAGGVIGSAVGSGDGRAAATVAGTIIGMVIGSTIGHRMDETDRFCVGQTLEYGVARRPVEWRNPDTGDRYTVTPLRAYWHDGRYCRRYVTDAYIGARRRQIEGTACRGRDGTWRVVH